MSDDLVLITPETFVRIRAVLVEARRAALSAVNTAMVQAYWNIGHEIVEEEQRGSQRADYGARLLETLAAQLTVEFGKGFDASNLRYMRLVYLAFPIRDALRHELSWTHYRLLCRVANPEARQLYLPVSSLSSHSMTGRSGSWYNENRYLNREKLMTMTLHVTVDLDSDEQHLLQAQAQQQGLTLEGSVQAVIARLARRPDPLTFRMLPHEERNRLLALQAEDAAPMYAAALARPLAERELTAFSSLEG